MILLNKNVKTESVKFIKNLNSSKELGNIFSTRREEFSFVLCEWNKKVSVSFYPMKELSVDASYIFLNVFVNKIPCTLMLSSLPLKEYIDEYISDESLDMLPKNLALATILAVLDPLIQTIESGINFKLEIVGYSTILSREIEESIRVPFVFKIEGTPESIAVLLFDSRKISDFIPIFEKIPAISSLQLKDFDTPVYFEKGYTVISKSLVTSIDIDDTLIMEFPIIPPQDSINLRMVSGQKFKMKKIMNKDIFTLTGSTKEKEIEQGIILEEIPITITYDLGKTKIPLGDLEKIGIGYTLELDGDLGKLVTLRIENKVFGQGEIVEIGGRLGVRVTQLNILNEGEHDGK